jgi:hypothetical protein
MFGFMEWKKEQKQKALGYRKELSALKRELAEKKIGDARRVMLSKQCPINRNELCFDRCVHFSDGYVSEYCYHVRINFPRCTLMEVIRN